MKIGVGGLGEVGILGAVCGIMGVGTAGPIYK